VVELEVGSTGSTVEIAVVVAVVVTIVDAPVGNPGLSTVSLYKSILPSHGKATYTQSED